MSLTSPRFTSSEVLRTIDAGHAALRAGSHGRAVHLVQMALLDLGIAMPRSTRSENYSPDGIYGEETKEAVKQFQKTISGLNPDGVVGKDTLNALDSKFKTFGHRVKLHFRSIALTDVPFQKSLSNAETVYAQYGIKVEFASGQSIKLTPEEDEIFKRIDQECNWEMNDGEFNDLQNLGPRVPSTDVLVFYVSTFADSTVLGCGGHATNKPACTITANAFAWDTAHEVCHVLMGSSFSPVHIDDGRNLMNSFSRRSSSIPVLTNKQVAAIRNSVCCTAIV